LKRYYLYIIGILSVLSWSLNLFGINQSAVSGASLTLEKTPNYIYFFWGDGCPHCEDAKTFLHDLDQRYRNMQIESFEVWYDQDNQALFQQMTAAYDFEPQYVPTIFIGEKHWVGFNETIQDEIEAMTKVCTTSGCPDAGVNIIPGHEPSSEKESGSESTDGDDGGDQTAKTLQIPLLGKVNLDTQSLWVSTALISFVDGFNPCSLWVLSILIAITLRTGSRKKIFIIGLTFITVTALVYVLFIAGLFTMLTITRFLGWIQVIVSVLALFFAVINIKDYFWYKEGLSFTIDDDQKPGLYKRMRKVLQAGDSLGALMVATVGLGLGVSLIEFSCTAGFPVLWTNLVAAQNVTPLTFALLLLLYMVIYQIDEFAIFMVAVVTLRANKLEEKHGRILKLIGGMLMLTLAGVMLVDPSLMDTISSSLLIFGVAFLSTAVILLVHRKVLPHYGIYLGTEMQPKGRKKKRRSSRRR